MPTILLAPGRDVPSATPQWGFVDDEVRSPPRIDQRCALATSQFIHRGGTPLSTTTIPTTLFTGLFEEFSLTQFLLDPSMLDELSESPDSILNRLVVSQPQLDHANLLLHVRCRAPQHSGPNSTSQMSGPTAQGVSDRMSKNRTRKNSCPSGDSQVNLNAGFVSRGRITGNGWDSTRFRWHQRRRDPLSGPPRLVLVQVVNHD